MIKKVPTDPPFTYKELKKVIPKHCFERSHIKSFSYLGINLLLVFLSYWIAANSEYLIFNNLESFIPAMSDSSSALSLSVHGVFWVGYWMVQGALCTGVWVIAHECGHRAFSPSNSINDTVGLILHSALLVPYHSWRISHGNHHQNTNHLEYDEVFVPRHVSVSGKDHEPQLKDQPLSSSESFLVHSWLGRLFLIVLMLTVGWPIYLLTHLTGRSYPGWVNHFSPYSAIFSVRQRRDIVISDLGLVVACAILYFWVASTSLSNVIFLYGIPYLLVNFWLVLITFLQHSDEEIPHYDTSEWSWIKGALCTVDRDYGILNTIFHHICDTHTVHHLFPKIPHYHAVEATKHLSQHLGGYYRYDNKSVARTLWKAYKRCVYVKNSKQNPGVYWWVSIDQMEKESEATDPGEGRR